LCSVPFAAAVAPAVADTHTWTDAAVANSFRQQQTDTPLPNDFRPMGFPSTSFGKQP
jgi:hypothetical protein